MITQAQIKILCEHAISLFKKYMPDVGETPKIHIVTDKILAKRHSEVVEHINAPQKELNPEAYNSLMETIHGESGDAIIIRQFAVRELIEMRNDEIHDFLILFWYELGRLYAIDQMKTDFYSFMEADLDENDLDGITKQEGYRFWSEFAAHCIAFHVDYLHCSIDNKKDYHPEKMEWSLITEYWMSEKLLSLLNNAVDGMLFSVDTDALAIYFATILKDDITVRYLLAPEQGATFSTNNWLDLTMISRMKPAIQEKFE